MKKIQRLFVVERGRVGSDERFAVATADYREALDQYGEARLAASYEAKASGHPQEVALSSYEAKEPVEAELDAWGRLIGADGEEIEYFNFWERKTVHRAAING